MNNSYKVKFMYLFSCSLYMMCNAPWWSFTMGAIAISIVESLSFINIDILLCVLGFNILSSTTYESGGNL